MSSQEHLKLDLMKITATKSYPRVRVASAVTYAGELLIMYQYDHFDSATKVK